MSRDKKGRVKKDSVQENINAELGGMGIYGSTSNEEVAGYKSSGDIENAGQLDKGYKRPNDAQPRASIKEEEDKS